MPPRTVSQSVSQSHPDRRADRTNERTKRQANSDSAKDATGNDDGTPLELAEKWRERASSPPAGEDELATMIWSWRQFREGKACSVTQHKQTK